MELNPSSSWLARHEFSIRRLQSLSGLLPVGAFLVIHLLTNASVLDSGETFQRRVDQIHGLGHVPLLVTEWTLIFLPLIFHAAIGVVILRSGEFNTTSYRYGGNVRYTLQRATAWIALFFILYHVLHMHGWIKPLTKQLSFAAQFDPEHAADTAAAALQPVLIQVVYAIGVAAVVFHFANGLWTMGITWGLWTSPAAQRRANYLCAVVGVALLLLGWGSLLGFSRIRAFEEDAKQFQTETADVAVEGY